MTASAAARRSGVDETGPPSWKISSTAVNLLANLDLRHERDSCFLGRAMDLSIPSANSTTASLSAADAVLPSVSSPRARSELGDDSAPAVERGRDLALRGKSPTSCVTRRSPRSLSGARLRAGTRTMSGCPGRSTALAMMVAAASAIAARSASTVTASAMPSEKLRPRQPLVAIPRTGCAESSVAVPKSDGPIRPLHHARDKMLSGGEMQRDVSAIVYVCPRELGGRSHGIQNFLRDRACHRRHGRDESPLAVGRNRRRHASRDGT